MPATFDACAAARGRGWAAIARSYARQWDGRSGPTGGPCGVTRRLRDCRAAGVSLAYAACDWDRLPVAVALALAWHAVWAATP